MIEQRKHVQGTLPVSDGSRGVAGPAVAARVWLDELVFTHQAIAAGMGPMFLAATATVQQQQRFSSAFYFVVHTYAVHLQGLPMVFFRHEHSSLFFFPPFLFSSVFPPFGGSNINTEELRKRRTMIHRFAMNVCLKARDSRANR
jgi:hypothetical protein